MTQKILNQLIELNTMLDTQGNKISDLRSELVKFKTYNKASELAQIDKKLSDVQADVLELMALYDRKTVLTRMSRPEIRPNNGFLHDNVD